MRVHQRESVLPWTHDVRTNFIGGAWVEPEATAPTPVIDPATGETIAEVASSNDSRRRRRRGSRGQAAFDEWAGDRTRRRGRSPAVRWPTARGQRRRARRDREPITSASRSPPSPTRSGSWSTTSASSPSGARNLTTQAPGEYLGRLHLDPSARAARRRGLIAPWNYPMMMAGWKIGPALAAGQHRRAQAVRAHAAHRARSSPSWRPTSSRPGCFNVITGDGEHAGAALVAHPMVRIVSLTGEVTTGKVDHARRSRHA